MAANTVSLTIDIIAKGEEELRKIHQGLDKVGDAEPKIRGTSSALGVGGLAAAGALAANTIANLAGSAADFVRDSINIASRMEGLKNGLKTVIPDAKEFEDTLAAIDKQARLPGLQKADLVRFTTNMRAAGLTGKETSSALTILGSRITGFGQTSAEAAQVVGQFAQAMNRGKIEGDELNRLFESLPGFKNIVVEMTGVTGGAQELNKAFEAQGLTVQEGLIPLLEAYDTSLGGISYDAALTKQDAFAGSMEDLQQAIGEKLLPVFKQMLDEGAFIIDFFTNLISGAGETPAIFVRIGSAFESVSEALSPLLEPLQTLSDAVLPLLQTVWNELVDLFIDFVIPTLAKIIEAVSPLYTALINLTTPLINLTKTILPPLMTLFKGLAGIILDFVLVPIRELAGAFGWVIEKITSLVNLIPGAKTAIESQTESTAKATEAVEAQAQATEDTAKTIEEATTTTDAMTTAQDLFRQSSNSAADAQGTLKVAVTETNIELKQSQAALKDASDPISIQENYNKVVAAIESAKDAKIAEAQSFDDESKKQIAIMKAEETAQKQLATATQTATKNRENYEKELTATIEAEAKARASAIEKNNQAELDQAKGHYVDMLDEYETAKTKDAEARKTAFADVLRAMQAAHTKELEEARFNGENIGTLQAEQQKDRNDALRKFYEDEEKIIADEDKAKVEAAKAHNAELLDTTKAGLTAAESAYQLSNDAIQKDRDAAFGKMITALETHHAAELEKARLSGENTKTLEAEQNAEIAKLENEHNASREKAFEDSEKEKERIQKEAHEEYLRAEKASIEDWLTATQDALDDKEQKYQASFDATKAEQETAYEEYITALIEHYDALIEKAKVNGEDITRLEMEKNAAIEKASNEHTERMRGNISRLRADFIDLAQTAQDVVSEALVAMATEGVSFQEAWGVTIGVLREEFKSIGSDLALEGIRTATGEVKNLISNLVTAKMDMENFQLSVGNLTQGLTDFGAGLTIEKVGEAFFDAIEYDENERRRDEIAKKIGTQQALTPEEIADYEKLTGRSLTDAQKEGKSGSGHGINPNVDLGLNLMSTPEQMIEAALNNLKAGKTLTEIEKTILKNAGYTHPELFHSPQADRTAYFAGFNAAQGTSDMFPIVQTQQKNAADFSKFFGTGYEDASRIPPTGRQQAQPIEIHITNEIPVGDEVIRVVSKRQAELDLQDNIFVA